MNMPANPRPRGSITRSPASRQPALVAVALLTMIGTLAICTSFFLAAPSARAWAPLPAPPPPPAVYYGRILAGPGFTPTVGMTVTAWIGGTPCGQAQTQDIGGQVSYAIDVLAEGERAGCGALGRVVTFRVNAQLMNPQTLWDDSQPHELDLWPAPPAVPVLLSPANGTVTNTNTLTLRWQASPGAAGYHLDLAGTVQDVGNVTQHTTPPLADGTYTWTVAAYDAVGNVSAYASPWSCTVDTVSPIVISLTPPDGAVEVTVDASVVIAFSRPMNAGTLIFTVSPDPDGWSTLWDVSGTVATLSHNPFDYQQAYTITIIAAEDLLGNLLAGTPYTWQFTTASARFYLPLVLRDYQPPLIPWPTGK